MQNRAPGVDIPITVQLLNEAGDALAPSSAVRWRVLDEADAEVLTWAAATATGATVTVTVPAAQNTIPEGQVRAMRRIEVEVTTDDGVFNLSETYLLQASTALQFGINTFLTHNQAVLLSLDFAVNFVQAWTNALTRDDQEQALIQAHARIIKLPLKMEYESDQSRIITAPWGRYRFEDMTPAQVSQLDARMLRALKRAQLLEAAYIMTEDGVNAARKQGLMSMTTGESSQFFRPAKPLELGVCRDAYLELSRWMDRSVRLGRG